jgi:hypothetical protein
MGTSPFCTWIYGLVSGLQVGVKWLWGCTPARWR